jgi:hypothetical protein
VAIVFEFILFQIGSNIKAKTLGMSEELFQPSFQIWLTDRILRNVRKVASSKLDLSKLV